MSNDSRKIKSENVFSALYWKNYVDIYYYDYSIMKAAVDTRSGLFAVGI